ncbi:CotS family spore coat protein [Clostridium cylindrosporum]|uniref:Spore coat protein CotS n=1 Tax=Clostridium cylindrosporum DSM 605 TaxID=1121307 RepID=A0A0J8DF75_CLOCY|nr:CotS family spore coat protein [Clostridium cylindrosporum]KMT22828.1 spore coat protein CotS [Clostridium cylindrosporum DSM 605]
MMVREIEISTQFDFDIKSLTPMKGVYLAETSKGKKCLKKINYGTSKLMYIHAAKEHIIENGFQNIDRFNIAPRDEVPYALVNDDIYVVTDWIKGSECDFKKRDDLEIASKTLGKFHLHARGFEPSEELRQRSGIGKYTTTIEKRASMLLKMREMARKKRRKSDFDMMYLSNVDFYYKLAQRAIKELSIDSYARVCEDSLRDKVLAHHDFAYHNIIIDENENTHIIDFDYCKSEMQIYDVATLCTKALKRLDWNNESFMSIFNAYNTSREVNKDEINVLKTLLIFPQRFWRVANRYYYKEALWSEGTFNRKMNSIINEQEKYMNFIDSLSNLI